MRETRPKRTVSSKAATDKPSTNPPQMYEGGARKVIAAMYARVNNYIVKPFTPDVLREKINLILKTV